MNTNRRVPWSAVATFAAISCGLAWLIALPMWRDFRGLEAPAAIIYTTAMMFTPAVATLVTMYYTRSHGTKRPVEFLGIWPLRPILRTLGLVFFGVTITALIVIAGAFLAATFGFFTTDFTNFSGFMKQIEAASDQAVVDAIPVETLVAIQIIAIPFAAIIPNGILAFGEEIGWRGWLLPTLLPLGTWPALLITGALWGFWHSPLILLGYNFGYTNITGVLLMMAACTAYGVLFGWLRLRSASVWPAVFAHGSLNAAGGFAFLIIDAGSLFNPDSSGPLGWVTWIVIALVVAILAACGQFTKRKLPELAADTDDETQHNGAKTNIA